MDQFDDKGSKNISWWITSLAISILLCAVFAGYIFDIKADLKNSKTRDDILEQRIDMLTTQVENLRHRAMVQQVDVIPPPPNTNIQLPETTPSVPQPQPPVPAPAPHTDEAVTPPPAPVPPIPAPAPAEPPQPAKQ